MAGRATRAGHFLAKVLGIQLQQEEPIREDNAFGESDQVFVEQQPTVGEWLHSLKPSRKDALDYVVSLFPFLPWIGHYNSQWLLGDVVAGITIGAVVVPQGMAYAKLAALDVQFGLYSSFMGALTYWIVGTSKDISIGVRCYIHPII
jgi:solute carrier family 26 (sodium-independent sulfate anion transporter), member 11